ncbi:putative intraflagellar transport protein IFT88 [Leishmania major strain Friedlin]|uniref:Putative intraflagellar transport protein IFT88 n=1 Tax=Leishmania major TaxID=5664 RepID=E9AD91_LEIMA|nr:putative intraflagellar transport protein IFT88 [Leishmania major strain Friedlin]CAG9576717.1 intraflagellar_transport_protein_88_-_putative [Leishmania major strain Friedlin]CBZ12177.1 putative intraflagellar transport protein IFT88 [Leishmania major strain Friedlin]|eukprot:XP_003721920.1 putative intraflagellar transport protein IFT88 [Leishmania major strain Friedlin]
MNGNDEDIYAAFQTPDIGSNPWTTSTNPFEAPAQEAMGGNPLMQAPPSQWGRAGMGSAWGVPGSRMETRGCGIPGATRPMTSNRAVGFNSASTGAAAALFDPTGQARMANMAMGPAPPLKKRSENSQEEELAEMEKQVNKLIEESAMLALQKDYGAALEKAKDAGKLERSLCKKREQYGLAEQINVDLTYAVHFNLAVQYQNHQLYTEALNTYNLIIRNVQFPQAGRLRVNMGNIYLAQQNYLLAIKMYRKVLDETPAAGKEFRYHLCRNIANAFVKLGQYRDAANSYETVVEGNGDVNATFNLILCYYALGETEKMKRTFTRLMNCRLAGLDGEEDFEEEEKRKDVLVDDSLSRMRKERRARYLKYIITAARLIAPVLHKDWCVGYDYIISQLRTYEMRDPTSHVASELEMCKNLNYLKHKRYQEAINGLKEFEKKDRSLRARAATNLAYLYFLEGDYENGEQYSDLSLVANQYNAKALVNKGNFSFVKKDYDKAKELYNKALAVEADNVEAIYNLGLAAKKLGLYEEAVRMFKRVQALVDSSEVLYQIADLSDLVGDPAALEWFNRLIGRVPTDPNALARIGSLYARDSDDVQAFHYYLEAYRYYQVNMDVISWLGAYFVKNEVYDKAVQFFERASHIQPQEVKWQLMVASCHRRRGDYVQAKRLYEQVHRRYPDNIECLNYLVQLCKDAGLNEEANEWFKATKKVERQQIHSSSSSVGGESGDDDVESSVEGGNNINGHHRRRTSGTAAPDTAVAGRRAGGGAAADKEFSVGLFDDDIVDGKAKQNGAKRQKKAKSSDSDDEIDLPGI